MTDERERLREALDTEWSNGNVSNEAYERLAALAHDRPSGSVGLLRELDAMYVGGHPLRGYSRERQRGWDEAIATVRAALSGSSDPEAVGLPCQHEPCTEVFASDSLGSAPVIAIAWALAERSADGPHGSNERRRFRPLARQFMRDLLRDPRRAEAVRDWLAVRLTEAKPESPA